MVYEAAARLVAYTNGMSCDAFRSVLRGMRVIPLLNLEPQRHEVMRAFGVFGGRRDVERGHRLTARIRKNR